jgi:hypothetical protein
MDDQESPPLSSLHNAEGDEASARAGDGRADAAEDAIRRVPARTTATLIRKMRAVLARRLEQMESEPMDAGDKEMLLLGSMSRTLGKLVELDKSRASGAKVKATASPEMTELRKKIAERIDQLNRG